MHKNAEAASDYTRVIELEPDNSEAFFNRASCHRGRGALKYKIEDLSKAIELNPDFLRAYYERAEVFRLDNLFAEALGDYTKIIELDPGSTAAYYWRGQYFKDSVTPRGLWQTVITDNRLHRAVGAFAGSIQITSNRNLRPSRAVFARVRIFPRRT